MPKADSHRTSFLNDESGATVIEHAILSCAFALVIVTAVASGLSPREMFERLALILGSVSLPSK